MSVFKDAALIRSNNRVRKSRYVPGNNEYPITHILNNQTDGRYTVRLEYCGHPEKRYVARFCNEWIGQSLNYGLAVILAQEHYDNHKIDGA